MKELYHIGIIDDDPSKITQMITMIRLCCDDEDGQPLKEKYANYKLDPIEITLEKTTDDMVERIVEADVDAVIIDYKLSSQQSVSYSGVSLAKELNQRLWGFPVFVLTTYQDDLFDHELFDSYLVFDFDKPNTFKMLRAFWKVSFIKLGDEENASLKEIFLLRRQRETAAQTGIFPERNDIHNAIAAKVLDRYLIKPADMLQTCIFGSRVKHEMALEAAVVYDLCHNRVHALGAWDYVSHQVIASPFKPIDYMDKIDVLAMRYLPNTKIPCKYLVAELKKDAADNATIDQVLKYVDWVCSEYAYGDYEAVEACIIAAEYPENIAAYYSEVVQRYYTLGSHPVRNKQWNSLKLLRYSYAAGELSYVDVTPQNEMPD